MRKQLLKTLAIAVLSVFALNASAFDLTINGGANTYTSGNQFTGYGWGGVANHTFDNSSKFITFEFSNYDASKDSDTIFVTWQRSGVGTAPLNWGVDHAVTLDTILVGDFNSGNFSATYSIPLGTVPVAQTTDYVAGYNYILQAVASNNGPGDDANFVNYVSDVTEEIVAATDNDITAFSLSEEAGDATIDAAAHTVAIDVVFGTDLSTLAPTIEVSPGATVSPESGATVDFSTTNPQTFTVKAEDGTDQAWAVTVSVAPARTGNDITAFSFAEETGDATIDATAHTVDIEVAFGTDVTNLVAAVEVSEGATVDTADVRDYTNDVTLTVKAEDETEQAWIVTVTVADDPGTSIGDDVESVSVYPNPVAAGENVNVNGAAVIKNIAGVVVAEGVDVISTAGLTSGIYIVVTDAGSVKLIVE